MNFGPLEFAALLGRDDSKKRRQVKAAARRAASAEPRDENRLTVISGPRELSRRRSDLAPVRVFEAIAMTRGEGGAAEPRLRVRVLPTSAPLVLVLSAHRAVSWSVECTPEARLVAVMTAGAGDSKVSGADGVLAGAIGGLHAFRRGATEFLHLESEVRRVTGRSVGQFHAAYSTQEFVVAESSASEL